MSTDHEQVHAPAITLIVGDRKTGKTERLIEWLLGGPNRVVIVDNPHYADVLKRRIWSHAKFHRSDLGLSLRAVEAMVVTVGQVQCGALRGREAMVAVEDLSSVLHHLLGVPVSVVTQTASSDQVMTCLRIFREKD